MIGQGTSADQDFYLLVCNVRRQFLFSFHVGQETVRFDQANDIDVDIDLLQTDQILELLRKNNFNIIDTIERLPYPDVEYQTKRAYVWAEKIIYSLHGPSASTICSHEEK